MPTKKKPTTKKPATKRAAKKKPAANKAARTVSEREGARAGVPLAHVPVLWALQGHGQAVGLHVDDKEAWGGWDNGDVVACDLEGNIVRRWKLEQGVSALIADEVWRYAGCDDGNIYDLTGRAPRAAYEVDESASVLWIDIFRGQLVAADSDGALSAFDVDQRAIFKHAPKNASDGWLARCDASGAYLGNDKGVTKVDWSGKKLWFTSTENVGFGVQDDDTLTVFEGDWETANVLRIEKSTGKVVTRGSCFSTRPHYIRSNNAASCAAAADTLYGGTCCMLFAFALDGRALWEAPLSIGAPCSMAFHDGRLFMVTHSGVLACLDVANAEVGASKKTAKSAKATRLKAIDVTERSVVDAEAGASGITVECFAEGSKLRVRVVSPGYHSDWYCQFPRDIRVKGQRYLVDGVREATQGGFYRVVGDIRRLRN